MNGYPRNNPYELLVRLFPWRQAVQEPDTVGGIQKSDVAGAGPGPYAQDGFAPDDPGRSHAGQDLEKSILLMHSNNNPVIREIAEDVVFSSQFEVILFP